MLLDRFLAEGRFMPRIPASELERLKREVSLLLLIESQEHVLKKRGRDWVMRCVFHEDKDR
jgi:DNA primase